MVQRGGEREGECRREGKSGERYGEEDEQVSIITFVEIDLPSIRTNEIMGYFYKS